MSTVNVPTVILPAEVIVYGIGSFMEGGKPESELFVQTAIKHKMRLKQMDAAGRTFLNGKLHSFDGKPADCKADMCTTYSDLDADLDLDADPAVTYLFYQNGLQTQYEMVCFGCLSSFFHGCKYDKPDHRKIDPHSVYMAVYACPDLYKYVSMLAELCSLKTHKAAIKGYGINIRFSPDQTEDLCVLAVQNHDFSLCLIEKQTEQVCREAVKRNGGIIDCVEDQFKTAEIVAIAENNPHKNRPMFHGNFNARSYGDPGHGIISRIRHNPNAAHLRLYLFTRSDYAYSIPCYFQTELVPNSQGYLVKKSERRFPY